MVSQWTLENLHLWTLMDTNGVSIDIGNLWNITPLHPNGVSIDPNGVSIDTENPKGHLKIEKLKVSQWTLETYLIGTY